MKSLMKKIVIGFLLAGLAGASMAATNGNANDNGSFSPYKTDSQADSPGA